MGLISMELGFTVIIYQDWFTTLLLIDKVGVGQAAVAFIMVLHERLLE